MPAPSLELEMKMRDGKVAFALDALAAKEQKVEDGLGKIGKESKRAEADLARFAKRTNEVNATPLQKYEQQVGRLDQAFRRGLISQEVHSRALKRSTDAYNNATSPVRGLADAVEATALKYAGMHAVVGFFNSAIAEQKEKTDAAIASLRQLLNMRIELGQVGIRGEDTEKLTKYGLTREEAGQLALQGQNLGFQKDVEWMAQHRAGLGRLDRLAETAGIVPQLFNGAISTRESINLMGAAAEPSRLTPDRMAGIMGTAAAGAQPTAEAAESLFALSSLLAQKYSTAEQMATEVGWMQTKLQTFAEVDERGKIFEGKDLYESLQLMEQLQNTKEGHDLLWDGKNSLLGKRKEPNELFLKYKQIAPQMAERTALMHEERLKTNTPEQWVDRVTKRNLENPLIDETLKGISVEEDFKKAQEKRYGIKGNAGTIAQTELITQLEENLANPAAIYAAKMAMFTAQHFFGAGVQKQLDVGATAAHTFTDKPIDIEGLPSWKEAAEAAKAQKEAAAAMMDAARAIKEAVAPKGGAATRSIEESALQALN